MMKEKLALKKLKVQSFVCRLERCDLVGGRNVNVIPPPTGMGCDHPICITCWNSCLICPIN